jgi:hypothetical protein
LTTHDATDKSARLGQLDLNFAEYAGKGRVTRRYLLDEGKTNATIKVSSVDLISFPVSMSSQLTGRRCLTSFDS